MNLAMNQDQENHENQNIVPLSSNEIKSILKSQSESTFEDKNITNNSNFIKKSLIDIALDFESKQNVQEDEEIKNTSENIKNFQEENEKYNDENKIEEVKLDKENESEDIKDIQAVSEETNNEAEINNTNEKYLNRIQEKTESEKMVQNENVIGVESDNGKHQDNSENEKKFDENVNADDQTRQALDSVRDAVSQSINKSDDATIKNLEDKNEIADNNSEIIIKDYEKFKNILSSLSTLGEEAIFEVFKNKILEISHELAGYQIDKLPEQYEKKIKSFLKNINCYEDKITIEVNDEDFDALSKIKHFNKNNEKTIFVSNKELTRGDIILNCDGMRYSEKSVYST